MSRRRVTNKQIESKKHVTFKKRMASSNGTIYKVAGQAFLAENERDFDGDNLARLFTVLDVSAKIAGRTSKRTFNIIIEEKRHHLINDAIEIEYEVRAETFFLGIFTRASGAAEWVMRAHRAGELGDAIIAAMR